MMLPGLIVGTTDVNPMRFVKLEGSRSVVQASASTDRIIGVSGEGSYAAPFGTNSIVAGVGGSGTGIVVHGPLEACLVKTGGVFTVATMHWATSDGSGQAIAATLDGSQSLGGYLLENAGSGDLKTIIVFPLPLSD